jgi:FKBP-type peptidyl-prolyl cis-trans isomerase 2
MARRDFPAAVTPKPGLVFEAKGPRGEAVAFKVVSANDKTVTVRLLHPLVGRDIEFKVKVLSVDDPKRAAAAPPLPPGVVQLELDELEEP